jgi:hydroxymethylpyrimidine/phosphomethylpyrimidine kinase
MSKTPPIVLSFAASDPTGGAGLQADLLTIAALGGHPLSVVTAITVQDTHGVEALQAVEPDWILSQARRLLADIPVAAFKIGVLGSARNAAAVAQILAEHPRVPVVLDPVLASGRGDALSDDGTLQTLRFELLPRATVVTPNSLEARRLARAADGATVEDCAAALLGLGCAHALITGTHEPGREVTNTLYSRDTAPRASHWPRLAGEYHGSGCTLASALATLLAGGMDVSAASDAAQSYTWKALDAGFPAGGGQFLPNRFFPKP